METDLRIRVEITFIDKIFCLHHRSSPLPRPHWPHPRSIRDSESVFQSLTPVTVSDRLSSLLVELANVPPLSTVQHQHFDSLMGRYGWSNAFSLFRSQKSVFEKRPLTQANHVSNLFPTTCGKKSHQVSSEASP